MTDLFMAGFECSTQRRLDGVRLDLVAATAHDVHAAADYVHCASLGLARARDGLRWHRIEASRGQYDWSSWAPMVDAAQQAGMQVYWDLFHYGFPEWTGPLSPDFPQIFADYAVAAAREHVRLTGRPLDFCAMNEISFFCWAAKDGYFPVPDCRPESLLKSALVRAAIAACRAIAASGAGGEHIWAEPLIHVAPFGYTDEARDLARDHVESSFEAFDMIVGRAKPHLGGHPDLLGTIGVNIYPTGQWYNGSNTIPLGHHEYRPIGDMLIDLWKRYERPIMISETGSEGRARGAWLHYVCDEVRVAMAAGVPIRGICLYPVTAYPGWDNDRHCDAGLFSFPDDSGRREVHAPLLEEIRRQSALFDAFDQSQPARAAA
jgi:hypothetical protein